MARQFAVCNYVPGCCLLNLILYDDFTNYKASSLHCHIFFTLTIKPQCFCHWLLITNIDALFLKDGRAAYHFNIAMRINVIFPDANNI